MKIINYKQRFTRMEAVLRNLRVHILNLEDRLLDIECAKTA